MSTAIHTLDAAERFCTERGLSLTPMRRGRRAGEGL